MLTSHSWRAYHRPETQLTLPQQRTHNGGGSSPLLASPGFKASGSKLGLSYAFVGSKVRDFTLKQSPLPTVDHAGSQFPWRRVNWRGITGVRSVSGRASLGLEYKTRAKFFSSGRKFEIPRQIHSHQIVKLRTTGASTMKVSLLAAVVAPFFTFTEAASGFKDSCKT